MRTDYQDLEDDVVVFRGGIVATAWALVFFHLGDRYGFPVTSHANHRHGFHVTRHQRDPTVLRYD